MADEILMEATDLDHTSEVLDEVLQQVSQQALRMSHLDEAVQEVKNTLVTLRGDIAAVPSQVQVPKGETAAHSLVDLEAEVKSLKGRLGLMLGFVILQLLVSGALVLFALKPMPPGDAPAPAVAEAPKPAAVPAAPPPAEVVNSENLLKPAAPPQPEEKPAAPAKGKKKKK